VSIERVALVLHHSRAVGTAKVILVGIANHDGPGGAWPSIALLANYANVTVRNAQKAVRQLEEMGELRVKAKAGGDERCPDHERPNLYEVLVTCPPDCDRTTHHRTRPPVASDTSPLSDSTPGEVSESTPAPLSPATPKPSLEPPSEPSVKPASLSAERLVQDALGISERDAMEFIEHIGYEHCPSNLKAWLRTVIKNGDLPDIWADYREAQTYIAVADKRVAPWCGQCDPAGQHNPSARQVEYEGGRWGMCPRCSPQATASLPDPWAAA
jgi:hypothetical protein